MPFSSLIERWAGHRIARRAADVGFLNYARFRVAQLDAADPVASQRATLRKLVHSAARTRFGRDHDFAGISTVTDYQARVPLRTYEQLWTDYWQAAYPRLQGITWPEFIPYYALSSGTTTGNTKYIPVSRQMLAANRKAALTTLALFRNFRRDADVFAGRIFFLGGSTDLKRQDDGSFIGDLSGIAAKEVSSALRAYTFPPLDLCLLGDWDKKVRILAERSATLPITFLSGVPAWMLTLFDHLRQVTGKDRIIDIWPQLKVVVHGGALFDPYRAVFRKVIGSETVTFQDTYPASEGYVATEDPRHGKLRLLPDCGTFFEFVPVEELSKDRPIRHWLGNLEVGVQYAVVLTTCAGVWANVLGDTVCFEEKNPPLLRFTGRTKYFLSAFGEHLISEEVEKAVAMAAAATAATVTDFHVGPIFPTESGTPGHHRYFVEFDQSPREISRFAEELDQALHVLNKDYGAYRVGGASLGPPEVVRVPRGGFGEWMRSRGKFGGQNKVPRMDNTGKLTEELGRWLSEFNGR